MSSLDEYGHVCGSVRISAMQSKVASVIAAFYQHQYQSPFV